MNPATGPKSTSFKLSVAGILTGLGTLITGLVHNPNAVANGQGAVSDVRTAVGAAVVAGSIIIKLIHDKGFNAATIAAAGNDIAQALPEIKTNLSKAASLVESDFPALQTDYDKFKTEVSTKLNELATHVTSVTGITPQDIEDAVRHILGNAVPITPPPPATATPPTAPPTAAAF
jgi:hypothetical protein